MKEDLLEIEETTDDTGTTSDIDSLTLNLSSLSNNYILQSIDSIPTSIDFFYQEKR